MNSQGEIEAAVCDGIRRFELEYMGRGPKDVHTYLVADLLVVRMTGVLTVAEQHLIKSATVEKGRDLVKQVRSHLVEAARPELEAMIESVTGVKVIGVHHDISTTTGDKMIVFTLVEPPSVREVKNGRSRSSSSQAILNYSKANTAIREFSH